MSKITDKVMYISDTVSCRTSRLDRWGYSFWNRVRDGKGILKSEGWTHDVTENKSLKKGTFARCHDVHENTYFCASLTHDVNE